MTKVIFKQQKVLKKEINSKKDLTEPFTILLMGVDSEQEDISQGVFNGDSLLLLTFNPKTLSTTILSIPRDSYVPIACFEGNRRNKITCFDTKRRRNCLEQVAFKFAKQNNAGYKITYNSKWYSISFFIYRR